MTGAIGTCGHPHPGRHLIADYLRLPAKTIPRWGTTTVEWPEKQASASLTRVSPAAAVIETGGLKVEVELRRWPQPVIRGRRRGIRMRWVCPRCGASRDALHWIDGAWGCRGKNCLVPDGLGYPCRHRQRYCPAIARRARLLRKLIRTPPKSLKARMLRKMIAHEQRAMIAHLEKVNRDLAKRSKRDARHRRANSE